MKQPYQPRELSMIIMTTPNEVIALGHLISIYLSQSARILKKTREHQEFIALLEQFQCRVVAQAQQSILPSHTSMEVHI